MENKWVLGHHHVIKINPDESKYKKARLLRNIDRVDTTFF